MCGGNACLLGYTLEWLSHSVKPRGRSETKAIEPPSNTRKLETFADDVGLKGGRRCPKDERFRNLRLQ